MGPSYGVIEMEQVECMCGCGGLRPKYDNWGREMRYINGHTNRGCKGRKHTEETKQRMGEAKMGKNNPMYGKVGEECHNWKGDAVTDNAFRARARTIYQRYYQTALTPDIVVHHIDLNFRNNDINNLALMARSAHSSLHTKLNREIYSKLMTKRDAKGRFVKG